MENILKTINSINAAHYQFRKQGERTGNYMTSARKRLQKFYFDITVPCCDIKSNTSYFSYVGNVINHGKVNTTPCMCASLS